MTLKNIFYSCFYSLVFIVSISTGAAFGFSGSHTPPLPFIIEVFCLPIGLLLVLIDVLKMKKNGSSKSIWIHTIGLMLNALVLIYTLSLVSYPVGSSLAATF